MPLDLLEIQKNIEEKRLILGQKIERFLFRKIKSSIKTTSNILQRFFAQPNSTFIVCALIFFASIFIRSSRDIGHDSAAYIAIAQKILQGGKYYHNFFENNFPLAFYLTIIPVYLAQIFSVSPIIALEIFVNLCGILAIYFSAKILYKADNGCSSNFHQQKTYSRSQIQLLIICFCVGYFLRVYTLQFNEYGTKSSYFLALAFPYIAYQITSPNSRLSQLIIGLFAGLIICLKPHYAMLPAVFEISKLFSKDDSFLLQILSKTDLKKKSFLFNLFCLRNFTSLLVVLGYIFLMLKFTPEYFEFILQFSAIYFHDEYINYFDAIKNDIFPLLLLSVAALPYLAKNEIFKPLFCAAIAASLIIIFELVGGYDQRTIFYSLSFSLTVAIVFFLLQERKINWRKDGLLILILLVLPQFDVQSFFYIILNLCYLWWLILFFDKKADRCLFVLAFIAIALMIFDKSGQISWLFSALIFLTLFKPKISSLAKKDGKILYLPKHSIILISLALSYFVSLFSAAIFNQQNLYTKNFKSPNYINERKAFFIAKYAPKKEDEVAFISDSINGSYPITTYFNKENSMPSLQLMMLYKNIYEDRKAQNKNIFHGKSQNENKALTHLFKGLKTQVSNANNKLIFIERKNYWNDECGVGFLEYYFQDSEFKKEFAKNYTFIDEIIIVKKEKILSDLLTKSSNQNILNEREIITNAIEIYLRNDELRR